MKFNHVNVDLEAGSRDEYHNFSFEGNAYPGMSNVLKKTQQKHKIDGLNNWNTNIPHSDYIARFPADLGTDTHKLIENYLSNAEETEACHLLAFGHCSQLKSLVDKLNNVHGLEVVLYSKNFKVAGTADTVAD